ncbi:DNA-binding protein [Streptomyces sp. NPDC087844]|uniref:DNA-binding protein n=1 Tax=Streptomyces sp. NPDC087844 TaxID=3365805 RepID=UPI0037F628C2
MNDATTADATTAGGTAAEAEELLRAGALLPPGTTGGGDRAVPMFTQAYRHPLLDDRTVVRLTSAEQTEEPPTGFLGLEPEGEPVEVGVGRPKALGFPDWVLVRHPSDSHLAMSLVDEMNKVAKTVASRPKRARAAYEAIGERLAGSVPHFLPTFYEQAGRVFLAADEKAYASQMFVNARKAETAHALPFDEARMDAVFLEFALADAVPTKILSSYAKGLSSRVPAKVAFRHLRGLFVRLAAHGLAPSSPGAGDLRRLAKAAADKDALAEEVAHLREMLPLPGTVKAPLGWWKTHRPALLRLTRQEPAFRATLLGMMPSEWEREELPYWLDLLEASGATAGLCDAALPAGERSPDGTAGWTHRFVERCEADRRSPAPDGLRPLVDRMAGVLRAELAATGSALPPPVGDVDLLDQMLALGVPVEGPGEDGRLELNAWADREERRDLLALEADPRFRRAFMVGCPRHKPTLLALVASPGGRPMLAEWVGEASREYLGAALPAYSGYRGVLHTLSWLPGEVLAVAEDAVREALTTGVAPALARALRTGLLDEVGWPAWEEALDEAAAQDVDPSKIKVTDAWPYLVVLVGRQLRVIGAEGTVLVHDLRLPDEAGERIWRVDCQYVDGELFVWWYAFPTSSGQGYWHHSADSPPLAVDGAVHHSYFSDVDGGNGLDGGMSPVSLPLPGGGRTTGHGVLRRGDTVVPGRRHVIGDGTSYWVWIRDWSDARHHTWHSYDPVHDTVGEPAMPEWFAEGGTREATGDSLGASWLRPAPSAVPGPMSAPVDGLLGWRMLTLPDGSRKGEDLAGRAVVVPADSGGLPAQALELPGTGRLLAVLDKHREIELLDTDGTVVAEIRSGYRSGIFTGGTALLPPLRYWHLCLARDPQGSAALREIGEDTVEALLAGAVAGQPDATPADDVPGKDVAGDLVRTLLPEIGHERLRAGVATLVRYAAEQQRTLDAVLDRLESARAGTAPDEPRRAVGDRLLASALDGIGLTEGGNRWYYDFHHDIFGLPALLARTMKGLGETTAEGTVHLDGKQLDPLRRLNATALPTLPATVALRAGTRATAEDHRRALEMFLAELDDQRLTEPDPAHWRRVRLRLDQKLFEGPGAVRGYTSATLLDLGGGEFLAFPDDWYRPFRHWDGADDDGRHYGALHHDPSGRFEPPAPYTLVSAEPFLPEPTRPPGWAAAFRAELAGRGPAPWFPAAAEEFARLTGVTPSTARLVVAGLPMIDDTRQAVPSETLKTIGVKAPDARVAKDDLRFLDAGARRAVVAALLPVEPSRLWSHGPDAAAAATVWNERLGRREPVDEEVLNEAVRSIECVGWPTTEALHGFLDVAGEPRLQHDLEWTLSGHWLAARGSGFGGNVLKTGVALTAWLAHRLPSSHPLRAVLPEVLTAIRGRLTHPGLLIDLGRSVDREAFALAAGEPTERGEDLERYGAVVLSTTVPAPLAAVRPSLLDAAGSDPHMAALFPGEGPTAAETALRLVHDRRFAELLADPGAPAAGARDEDGGWWPQDPSRSVPDLVAEAAKRYGVSEDAAVVYLMLLALPDPTDRNTARWTGWAKRRGGTARLRAARAELVPTGLVVEGKRSKAGRSLFLPGGWTRLASPHLPLERWKLPMYGLLDGEKALLGVVVPDRPVADLYREAWRRVQDGDEPRLEEMEVPRPRRKRR